MDRSYANINHGRGCSCDRPSVSDGMVAVALFYLGNCCIWGLTNGDSSVLDFEANWTAPDCIGCLLTVARSPLEIPTNQALHTEPRAARVLKSKSFAATW